MMKCGHVVMLSCVVRGFLIITFLIFRLYSILTVFPSAGPEGHFGPQGDFAAQLNRQTDGTGISVSIHCSLVTQPPMGPMGPETS